VVNVTSTVFLSYDHDEHSSSHSFPTRRSSDLSRRRCRGRPASWRGRSPCPLGPVAFEAMLCRRHREVIWYRHSNLTGCKQLGSRSEEHTSELQSRGHLVCRLLLEKKKKNNNTL